MSAFRKASSLSPTPSSPALSDYNEILRFPIRLRSLTSFIRPSFGADHLGTKLANLFPSDLKTIILGTKTPVLFPRLSVSFAKKDRCYSSAVKSSQDSGVYFEHSLQLLYVGIVLLVKKFGHRNFFFAFELGRNLAIIMFL
jgi:hypothetical protein